MAKPLPPKVGRVVSTSAAGRNGGVGFDPDFGVAGAAGAKPALNAQDALVLANVEARLTEEVRRLINSLNQFSRRTQGICVEVPDAAHFSKLVTSFLGLLGLQLAHALGKGLDRPIFFDDGAEYLRELNLCLSDFVREVDLDGRRFLAVALVDEQTRQLGSSGDGADKC